MQDMRSDANMFSPTATGSGERALVPYDAPNGLHSSAYTAADATKLKVPYALYVSDSRLLRLTLSSAPTPLQTS